MYSFHLFVVNLTISNFVLCLFLLLFIVFLDDLNISYLILSIFAFKAVLKIKILFLLSSEFVASRGVS